MGARRSCVQYSTHLAGIHLDESSMVSNDKLEEDFRPMTFEYLLAIESTQRTSLHGSV